MISETYFNSSTYLLKMYLNDFCFELASVYIVADDYLLVNN